MNYCILDPRTTVYHFYLFNWDLTLLHKNFLRLKGVNGLFQSSPISKWLQISPGEKGPIWGQFSAVAEIVPILLGGSFYPP